MSWLVVVHPRGGVLRRRPTDRVRSYWRAEPRCLSIHQRAPAAIPSVVGPDHEALLGAAEQAEFLHSISDPMLSPMRARLTCTYRQLAAPMSLCKLL
jgi:hypothetical protein